MMMSSGARACPAGVVQRLLDTASEKAHGVLDHAIVIAVEGYGPDSSNRAPGAIEDADRFIDWVLHPRWGNVPESNLHARYGSDGRHPTGDDVSALVQRVLALPRHTGGRAGRRLYLFLVGASTGTTTPSLLTSDLKVCALDVLVEVVRQAGLFDEIVLLADLRFSVSIYLTHFRGDVALHSPEHVGVAVPPRHLAVVAEPKGSERPGRASALFLDALTSARDEEGHLTASCLGPYFMRYDPTVRVSHEGAITLLRDVAERPPLVPRA